MDRKRYDADPRQVGLKLRNGERCEQRKSFLVRIVQFFRRKAKAKQNDRNNYPLF